MLRNIGSAGAVVVLTLSLATFLPTSSAAIRSLVRTSATSRLTLITNASITSSSRQSAWNGHVDPGSTIPTKFTPYWIPPGSQSFDDSHAHIHYSGLWSTNTRHLPHSRDLIGGTVHFTRQVGAEVVVIFNGTGVEWFGNTGMDYGLARVFLDGRHVATVTMHDQHWRSRQRIWHKHHLSLGDHSLRIVNIGRKGSQRKRKWGLISVDALVVMGGEGSVESRTRRSYIMHRVNSSLVRREPVIVAPQQPKAGEWTLVQRGQTGVHAMQLAVISESRALIVDKVEHNPLTIDGHPAWAAIYDFSLDKAYPIRISSNSFCAGGSFLGNGTMINVGGNPVVEDHTSAADFGDLNGLQAIRLLKDCDGPKLSRCFLYENHARLRLSVPRWYATVVRISDGSALIIGGSKTGGWINNATVNNPSFEYWPPKGAGFPIHSQFLKDTLNSNLFPIAFALPNGKVFVAANQDAMIYDWKANTERRLPRIPNGARVTYPMAGTGLLLPLDPANGYKPEILLCGGSAVDDKKPSWEISSQDPASRQCSRIVLDEDGIRRGWAVEVMPQARLMPDAVLLPTGNVFIVNGAQTGISGYGNVQDQKGASNADNPVFRPVLYSPSAPFGKRFSDEGLPASRIPRLYHSVATLLPDGQVLVAGSNPNLDRSNLAYRTEYTVEHFVPPYIKSKKRPRMLLAPPVLRFGKSYTITLDIFKAQSSRGSSVRVSLMDLGFVTHATHTNSRLVYLSHTISPDKRSLTIHAPPSGDVYPPGPGWLFVVIDGVPSVGKKVMVGDGSGPLVDLDARSKGRKFDG